MDGGDMGSPVVTAPPPGATPAPGGTKAPTRAPTPASTFPPPSPVSVDKPTATIIVDHGMSSDTILVMCLIITGIIAFLTVCFVVSSVRHIRDRAARTQRGLPPSHADKKPLPMLFIRARDVKTSKGPGDIPYITPPAPGMPHPAHGGALGRDEAEELEMTKAYMSYNMTNPDATPFLPQTSRRQTSQQSLLAEAGRGQTVEMTQLASAGSREHAGLSPLSSTRKEGRSGTREVQREPLLREYPTPGPREAPQQQQQPGRDRQRSARELESSSRNLQSRSGRDLQQQQQQSDRTGPSSRSGRDLHQQQQSSSRRQLHSGPSGGWHDPASTVPATAGSDRHTQPHSSNNVPQTWETEHARHPVADAAGPNVSQTVAPLLKTNKPGLLTPVTEVPSLGATSNHRTSVFCVDDFDETASPQMFRRTSNTLQRNAPGSASQYQRAETPPSIGSPTVQKDFYNEKTMALM